MVKTWESWISPSPNLDKVTVSFDKLNNAGLFPSRHQAQDQRNGCVKLLGSKHFELATWLNGYTPQR